MMAAQPPAQRAGDGAGGFTPEQKRYLEQFLGSIAEAGPFVGLTGDGRITATSGEASSNLAAPAAETLFGHPIDELTKQERWKLAENPLDIWEKLVAHADEGRFPDEQDTFRFKFHGLFYVAPAQDSFMLRIRVPAGELTSGQLRGLAEIASGMGGGYAHVTTRANVQIRELKPADIVRVLVRLQELGLTSRGAGADNVRNITASPTSGFDPGELIDVRPYAKGLHHYILNHRDLFQLPRKFNVAFDGGGAVCAAADTNDIGFFACRLRAPHGGASPGVYFRIHLGGITGHKDFARDTGLVCRPNEVVAVAAALIRVFRDGGDRTDRKKARLKYLLEKWGMERFLAETRRRLAFPLLSVPAEACEPPRPFAKHGWIGAHRQSQEGLSYVGVGMSAGRMSAKQMRQLADLATEFASGELRLTVWQNLIIPNVEDARLADFRRAVEKIGFTTDPEDACGGIVACTGNAGCKYAFTDTKAHAAQLARAMDRGGCARHASVNIHFTGCPHSCAQHYCGDIGLLGTKLADGTEAYHVVLGGGMGDEQGIAREVFRGITAAEVPELVSRTLAVFSRSRQPGESFVTWSRRHTMGELQELLT
jgi:ferredoxin-nitrite reductase